MDFEQDLKRAKTLKGRTEKIKFWNRKLAHAQKRFEKISQNLLPALDVADFHTLDILANSKVERPASIRSRFKNYIEAVKREIEYLEDIENNNSDDNRETKGKNKPGPITRQIIINKANTLKEQGYTIPQMFDILCDWLADKNYNSERTKKEFNFSLKDPHHFNRWLNKQPRNN